MFQRVVCKVQYYDSTEESAIYLSVKKEVLSQVPRWNCINRSWSNGSKYLKSIGVVENEKLSVIREHGIGGKAMCVRAVLDQT